MSILAFLIAVASFMMIGDVKRRLKKLEDAEFERGKAAQAKAVAAVLPMHTDAAEYKAPEVSPIVPQSPVAQHAVQSEDLTPPLHVSTQPTFDLVAWLAKDWLLKLGALCVLIAFGWFVSYAFINGWVGPFGKIALGLCFGTILLAFGWWRIKSEIEQGAIFLALGAAINLLVVYAARSLYDMFTPATALVLMFATSAFVAYMSALYRHKTLAVLGVLLAGTAPFLTATSAAHDIGLFSYLLVVVLGSMLVAWYTRFGAPSLVSLGIVAIYSMKFVGASILDERMLVFGMLFACVFFVAGIVRTFRRGVALIAYDITLAVGNAALLLFYIVTFAPADWQSLIVAAWMSVFLLGAFLTVRMLRARSFFFIYAGIGLSYLVVATALELEGNVLVVALATEAAVIIVATDLLLKSRTLTERVALLMAGPAFLAVEAIVSPLWQMGVIQSAMFTLLTVGVLMVITGFFTLRRLIIATEGKTSFLRAWHIPVGFMFFSAIAAQAFALGVHLPLYLVLIAATCVPPLIRSVLRSSRVAEASGTLLLIPSLIAIQSLFAPEWQHTAVHGHMLVLLVAAGCLSVLAYVFYIWRALGDECAWYETLSGWYAVLASGFAAALVWLISHAYLSEGQAVALSLIVYVITGLSTYLYGVVHESAMLRKYGTTVLALAFGRLLLVDVWVLELLWRIVTFFVIGLMLLGTAFIRKGKVSAPLGSVIPPTTSV